VLQPSPSNETHASPTTAARFPTMTADTSSAVASNTPEPTTLAGIPEGAPDVEQDAAEEMDTTDAKSIENSNVTESHIIIRFASDGKPTNVASLLKSVLTWLFEIDSTLYLETNNTDWKFINSIQDFPNKEVDFMKCFDPTTTRGSQTSVVIGMHLFSQTSIGLMKKNHTSFMQYLKSKRIGIKESCGGSKNESTVCGLLSFNPDKVHRASITRQIHNQLATSTLDMAEKKLLQKAQEVLPFSGIVPDFQLMPRWINAENKKYSAKGFSVICATEHADYFKAFLIRCYHEKHVIGLGWLVQFGGNHSAYIPNAITWHNNFVDECAIVSLLNISREAMDQQFTRKNTASTEETTTIRRILLTEGKATNIYESRDIESDGRWIVGINSEKVEHLTVIVATTICKLYEREQILPANQSAKAPFIERPKPRRRKSNESAVSGFDDDDHSIQSMQSKTWSKVAKNDSGSIPKFSTNKRKTIHFVYDPESTEEFPPLPAGVTTANSPRNDNSSMGSTSTVTKSEFESFQTKLTKDLAAQFKACQASLTSSVTGDSTQSTVIEEMRAERIAMQTENQESRRQQQEQMNMFMQQMQQMMGHLLDRDNQQQHQQQYQHQHQQQQQHQHQQQQQQQQYHAHQQHLAQQQHSQSSPQQQQQQQQQHQQQYSPQQSPQKSQQLFTGTPSPSQQHLHYSPEQQQHPNSHTYTRPPGPGGYFELGNPAPPPQPQPHQRPAIMPPDTVWDSYHGRIVPNDGAAAYAPQQQAQISPAHRHPEEQVEFDHRPHGQTQMSQPSSDHHMSEHQQKSAPGGSGPTDMTPPAKKKSTGTNATSEYYAKAPPGATFENSPSQSAGGGE
jgi:hypothetical protein